MMISSLVLSMLLLGCDRVGDDTLHALDQRSLRVDKVDVVPGYLNFICRTMNAFHLLRDGRNETLYNACLQGLHYDLPDPKRISLTRFKAARGGFPSGQSPTRLNNTDDILALSKFPSPTPEV